MTRMKTTVAVFALTAVALTGCNSTKNALGLNKVVPDEFKVITKAPLVVPPDYALRPPSPGEPRPQELQPESAARDALLGQREQAARSDGEKLFVMKAGADKADPLARYVVDDEFGDIAYKEKSFADSVLFWKKEKTATLDKNAAAANEATPVDANAEAAHVKALIGDSKVVIQQKKDSKLKLPGL